jgi:hypothetical protein
MGSTPWGQGAHSGSPLTTLGANPSAAYMLRAYYLGSTRTQSGGASAPKPSNMIADRTKCTEQ